MAEDQLLNRMANNEGFLNQLSQKENEEQQYELIGNFASRQDQIYQRDQNADSEQQSSFAKSFESNSESMLSDLKQGLEFSQNLTQNLSEGLQESFSLQFNDGQPQCEFQNQEGEPLASFSQLSPCCTELKLTPSGNSEEDDEKMSQLFSALQEGDNSKGFSGSSNQGSGLEDLAGPSAFANSLVMKGDQGTGHVLNMDSISMNSICGNITDMDNEDKQEFAKEASKMALKAYMGAPAP